MLTSYLHLLDHAQYDLAVTMMLTGNNMKIYTSLTECLQHLTRAVAKDQYTYWTGGEMARAKVPALGAKFAEIYGTELPRHTRHYRKGKGLANAQLFILDLQDHQRVTWILVATEGAGLVRDQEKLVDARISSGRLMVGDYLLQDTTRPKEHGGGTHWSWWIRTKTAGELQAYAAHLVKEDPEQLWEFLRLQVRRPLMSGTRSQVRRLLIGTQKLFERVRPGLAWKGPIPDDLPFLGTFLPNRTSARRDT